MPEMLHDLVNRWKQQPTAAATVELCEALRSADSSRGQPGAPSAGLVEQVAAYSIQNYGNDADVLCAVGRLYLASNRLDDAQATLVSAGRIDPRNSDVYRWLGEVLLRRGDAERAQKVLERAAQLGSRDPDTKVWLGRAEQLKSVQLRAGERAVVAEVKLFLKEAELVVFRPPLDSFSDHTTTVRNLPDEVTEVAQSKREPRNGEETDTIPNAFGTTKPVTAQTHKARTSADRVGISEVFVDIDVQAQSASRAPVATAQAMANASLAKAQVEPPPPAPRKFAASPKPPPLMPPPPAPAPPSVQRPVSSPPSLFRRAAEHAATSQGPTASLAADYASSGPSPSIRSESQLANGTGAADQRMPHPRDVLDALKLAGIYEHNAPAAAAVWQRAARTGSRKPVFGLVALVVLISAGLMGAFAYARQRERQAHAKAEQLLAEVEGHILAGDPNHLREAEDKLGRVFELESRSSRAAADWLHERILAGLIRGGEDLSFEDAIRRGREVGLTDNQVAAARVASFYFQGDTAGAIGLLTNWDAKAADDPWYELMAGVALERAGDGRARERFTKAATLLPNLFVAQLAFARNVVLTENQAGAKSAATAFAAKYPGRAEGTLLVALAWTRDGANAGLKNEPAELERAQNPNTPPPASLAFVPPTIRAMQAQGDAARPHLEKAIASADSPNASVWLGELALARGERQLAQKAAVTALALSAAYAPARILAGKVALTMDRLDEALKAVEDIDPKDPDRSAIAISAAYEKMDVDGVSRASSDTNGATSLPSQVLVGANLSTAQRAGIANRIALWGELIAFDAAVVAGDLEAARKLVAGWKTSADLPSRALRSAQLARFSGQPTDAAPLLRSALERGNLTLRDVIERTQLLVAEGKAQDALSQIPNQLGPMGSWLRAYVLASLGKTEEARGIIYNLDPPGSMAPLACKIVVFNTYAALHDKRKSDDYARTAGLNGLRHPDLTAGAAAQQHAGRRH